jgi:hypothetical protein
LLSDRAVCRLSSVLPLDELRYEHLEALVTNHVPEAFDLDFKRELYGSHAGPAGSVTVSDGNRLGRTRAEPPIWTATWVARVPVVAAPERVICVALVTSQRAHCR